jgi:hypothetical protein
VPNCGIFELGHSNWEIGTSSEGPDVVPGSRGIKLNVIVGRLQATYDLSGD